MRDRLICGYIRYVQNFETKNVQKYLSNSKTLSLHDTLNIEKN